jgi:hypothetical protein
MAVRVGLHGNCSGLTRLGELRAPQLHPARLRGRKRSLGTRRDERGFLLRQGGVQVKEERINIRSKLGHEEGHPLRHQPGYEVYVTGEPVEFGHDHPTASSPRLVQRRCQLWPPVECV